MKSQKNLPHPRKPSATYPEAYALLWVSRRDEKRLADFFTSWGVSPAAIQRGMHLTVYYARRILPDLCPGGLSRKVEIKVDVSETRFMVLAPGGENPRPDLDPSRRSLGIRLTKRNKAISQIQELRTEMRRFETPAIVGGPKPSTWWSSSFGARGYQPHIKLLRPGSEVDSDLTKLGEAFREAFTTIDFRKFTIKERSR
ncbi:MAG: hypothetical protein OXC80_06445 [Gammaproteobacteria bacterium]|nr:hypothetical protein [Gammaproteobacteria bacterium]